MMTENHDTNHKLGQNAGYYDPSLLPPQMRFQQPQQNYNPGGCVSQVPFMPAYYYLQNPPQYQQQQYPSQFPPTTNYYPAPRYNHANYPQSYLPRQPVPTQFAQPAQPQPPITQSETNVTRLKTESTKSTSSKPNTAPSEEKKNNTTSIMVGKRRGKGRALPTGVVKKAKTDDGDEPKPKDAWSQYMNEVRRYKDQSCEDERKNRPLVK